MPNSGLRSSTTRADVLAEGVVEQLLDGLAGVVVRRAGEGEGREDRRGARINWRGFLSPTDTF